MRACCATCARNTGVVVWILCQMSSFVAWQVHVRDDMGDIISFFRPDFWNLKITLYIPPSVYLYTSRLVAFTITSRFQKICLPNSTLDNSILY